MLEEPISQPPQPAGEEPVEEIDGLPGGLELEPVEVVDGEPVVTAVPTLERWRPPLLPVPVQAAAVAVTGFFAGLLTIVLVRRRHERRRGRAPSRRGARRRSDSRGNVVASRSFLVDVHLLGERD